MELGVQDLQNEECHSGDSSADTSLECSDALCMAGKYRSAQGGKKQRRGEKVPTHAMVCCVDVKPDAPALAWKKLFKPEGLLGYFGCGRVGRPACLGVCVCAFERRGGGLAPDVHTEPVQHNTPLQRALTPDLRPLHSCRTKTTRRREVVAASHTSKSLTSSPTAPSHSHLCGGKCRPGIQWGGTYDCNPKGGGSDGG